MLLHTTGYLPNEILNASYNYSKHETDLLLLLVDLYNGKPELVVSINTLTANWGETNSKHIELRKAFINLQSKPLEYYDQKAETYIIAAIIIESKIDIVKKLVTIRFSDKIGAILSKAKTHFSRYNFEVLLNLESRYSKRLYLHCNAFRKTGYWTIDIDHLRKALRLEDKYQQTFDFKKKILAPSFKEIQEKSELDIVVNYGSDIELVSKLLIDTAMSHPKVKKNQPIFVRMANFSDNGLAVELIFWADQSWDINNYKSDLRFEINRLFQQHKILIPYPKRSVEFTHKV